MSEQSSSRSPALALNTKVEDDFVSPLTAVRGSLEILRDYPDLSEKQRKRFLENALRECARLERGVQQLADSVYAAGHRAIEDAPAAETTAEAGNYGDRIRFLDDIVEIDLSEFEFNGSQAVNDFYDVVDHMIEATGRKWYVLVNYRDCTVWPEAWVAFAHRGKKVNVLHSLGTARYADCDAAGDSTTAAVTYSHDPNLFTSREAALARLAKMKASGRN